MSYRKRDTRGDDRVTGVKYGNPPGTRLSPHSRGCDLNVPPEIMEPNANTLTLEEYRKLG